MAPYFVSLVLLATLASCSLSQFYFACKRLVETDCSDLSVFNDPEMDIEYLFLEKKTYNWPFQREHLAEAVAISVGQFLTKPNLHVAWYLYCPTDHLKILYDKYPHKFAELGPFPEWIKKIENTLLMSTGRLIDNYKVYQRDPEFHQNHISKQGVQHGLQMSALVYFETPDEDFVERLGCMVSGEERELTKNMCKDCAWKGLFNRVMSEGKGIEIVNFLVKQDRREFVRRCLQYKPKGLISKLIKMVYCDCGPDCVHLPPLSLDDFRANQITLPFVGLEAVADHFKTKGLDKDTLLLIFKSCLTDLPVDDNTIVQKYEMSKEALYSIVSSSEVSKRLVASLFLYIEGATRKQEEHPKIISLFVHAMTCHPNPWTFEELYKTQTRGFPELNDDNEIHIFPRHRWSHVTENILSHHLHHNLILFKQFAQRAIPISQSTVWIQMPYKVLNGKIALVIKELLADEKVSGKLMLCSDTVLAVMEVTSGAEERTKILKRTLSDYRYQGLLFNALLLHHFAPGRVSMDTLKVIYESVNEYYKSTATDLICMSNFDTTVINSKALLLRMGSYEPSSYGDKEIDPTFIPPLIDMALWNDKLRSVFPVRLLKDCVAYFIQNRVAPENFFMFFHEKFFGLDVYKFMTILYKHAVTVGQ